VPPTPALADELWRRGWYVDRQQPPDSLHCTVNAVHEGLIPEFVAELHRAIDTIVETARAGTVGSYGTVE
jgi:sphinganine-1-phosphate aldolase